MHALLVAVSLFGFGSAERLPSQDHYFYRLGCGTGNQHCLSCSRGQYDYRRYFDYPWDPPRRWQHGLPFWLEGDVFSSDAPEPDDPLPLDPQPEPAPSPPDLGAGRIIHLR